MIDTDALATSALSARGDLRPVGPDGIVVGHDGSRCADEAVRYALTLARDLGAPLTVVRAWSLAEAPRPESWRFGYVSSGEEVATAVLRALVAGVGPLTAEQPEVDAGFRVVHSTAAKSLIHVARSARLLVVGSRGLGGFAGLVLGSVSEQCVRGSNCPVLVVRNPPGDG